jgi:YVTN family beta-propeller protein
MRSTAPIGWSVGFCFLVATSVFGSPPATLPNGWRVTPAGKAITLPGDMPVRMVFSSDGSKLFVQTAGYHDNDVDVIDRLSGSLIQSVNVQKDWSGMAMSPDGQTLYASGGRVLDAQAFTKQMVNEKSPDWASSFQRSVITLHWNGQSLSPSNNIVVSGWDDTTHFAGGAATTANGIVYMLDVDHNRLLRLIATVDAVGGVVTAVSSSPMKVDATAEVGYRPYAAAISADNATIAVSNWGDASVSLVDAGSMTEIKRIPVGSHPNDLVYAKDGRLFVSCGGSNTVSVIRNGVVVETIDAALTSDALVGATPDALALSPDGRRLYVADADNNDVAVIDIAGSASRVLGFIPTGWYPSAVAASPDGKTLFIGTAKGLSFRANYPPLLPNPVNWPDGTGTKRDYIGNVLTGDISAVPVPNTAQLTHYSEQVRRNTPSYAANLPRPIKPPNPLATGKIQHVLFIVRENKTYDEILGDLGKGNGDPSLAIFGRAFTPNAHALANQFVLFDKLYCNGEVSEDGHQWCDAAYATDFTEKAWPSSYSGRDEPDADERLTASPAGYLWDNCARHHLSFYSYGEMAEYKATPSGITFDGESSLAGHNSADVEKVQWGKQHDTARTAVIVRDLSAAEKTGVWPRFVVAWLGEDHTQGLSPGAFTPSAMVAGNDLGVAQLIDAVSHSRFWKSTAIFIIEDDAQNGPDHVDAHRTVGFVISPYIKRHVIDSMHYSTASMVHTMEVALGLPPMTQYDAGAPTMSADFTAKPDFTPYIALPETVDLTARNPSSGPGAQASAKLDFSGPDRVDPNTLNHILWLAMRPGVPYPAPPRRFGD